MTESRKPMPADALAPYGSLHYVSLAAKIGTKPAPVQRPTAPLASTAPRG